LFEQLLQASNAQDWELQRFLINQSHLQTELLTHARLFHHSS
jgi:hypothetical protein